MLIVKRSPTDTLQHGAWDLPGGRVEPNEDIKAAAIRETQEEVGITLQDPQLIFATSDMRGGKSKSWLFYTEQVPEGTEVTLGDEHDDFLWIAPSNFDKYTDYDILLRMHSFVMQNGILAA